MALETVVTGANNVLKKQTGISRVHENAPESLSAFPCTILVPDKGTLDWPRKASQRMTTHDLKLMLLVSRGGDLASADQTLKPWVQKLIDLFDQNITLNGSALNAGIVDYQYGHIEYAGVDYLGITATLRAVEMVQLVYHG